MPRSAICNDRWPKSLRRSTSPETKWFSTSGAATDMSPGRLLAWCRTASSWVWTRHPECWPKPHTTHVVPRPDRYSSEQTFGTCPSPNGSTPQRHSMHCIGCHKQHAHTQVGAVLRTGAKVMIQMVCASQRPSIEAVAMSLCDRPRWAARFAGFTSPFVHVDPATYGDLAAEAGLSLTRMTVTDRQWDFGSREDFAHWCSVGSAAWTERLAVDGRSEFVDEMVNSYETGAGRPGLFLFT
jgi:hypothetical protein